MIDSPAYAQHERLQEIRGKYGRSTSEGTSEPSDRIQDGVRSSTPEGEQPSRSTRGRRRQAEPDDTEQLGTEGTVRGNNSRKRRTNTKVDQSSSSTDRDSRTTDGAVQRPGVASNEDKPSGLSTSPNERERLVRQQAQEEAARAVKQEQPSGIKKIIGKFFNKDGSEKKKPGRKVFSEREAEDIREPLINAMRDYFLYADELMFATLRTHPQVMIWRTIDDEDIEKLASVWLTRARINPQAAAHVAMIVDKHLQIQVGMILVPRFIETFKMYVQYGVGIK